MANFNDRVLSVVRDELDDIRRLFHDDSSGESAPIDLTQLEACCRKVQDSLKEIKEEIHNTLPHKDGDEDRIWRRNVKPLLQLLRYLWMLIDPSKASWIPWEEIFERLRKGEDLPQPNDTLELPDLPPLIEESPDPSYYPNIHHPQGEVVPIGYHWGNRPSEWDRVVDFINMTYMRLTAFIEWKCQDKIDYTEYLENLQSSLSVCCEYIHVWLPSISDKVQLIEDHISEVEITVSDTNEVAHSINDKISAMDIDCPSDDIHAHIGRIP